MESSSGRRETDPRLILLSGDDNVCVAGADVQADESLSFEGGRIVLRDSIALGHKVAVRPIADGEKVIKYGLPIGTATDNIEPGSHVHSHNLKSDYLPSDGRSAENEARS